MPPSIGGSSTPASARRAESIHDFTGKLRQSSLWPQVARYVSWQRELRRARRLRLPEPTLPDLVPLSINLDLTTACNYRCDHCIDWDILNAKVKHADETLRAQMTEMAQRGMRSVILIGGGEPTLYPGFAAFVRHLKDLRLQVAVVSNGSRGDKLLEIAPYLDEGDWIRLSLDSGSNEVFQQMHKPSRETLTLDEICTWVPKIKRINPRFEFGFSFIITWRGGTREDVKVVENIHEIEMAARRARDAGFDYISYKPFLERADSGSEIMDPAKMEGHRQAVVARIREGIDAARRLEQPGFAVRESTNLRMLVQSSWQDLTKQPQVCHMQSLRQVLSPHGTFNCPAYRGVGYARVGGADLYKDAASVREASEMTRGLLDNFDASKNCAQVTCLYNQTNWWLERLIESEDDLDAIAMTPDRRDTFL
ncbi:MAG: radical SAM protein [Planctomycetota bacterium]